MATEKAMSEPRKPTKRQIARAKRLFRDPLWQFAFISHGILSHCYGNLPREERHKIYKDARIYDMIREAEERTR